MNIYKDEILINLNQQISLMKKMGIQFNILDEESTKLDLKNDNYYFKIMMFKDNYVKSNNGKYRI